LRLAEFKTRLFIFFAGRLLKWAESIEQKIDPQQLPPPVDDSKTVVLAESSGESEAASGPPEHWARLTTSGPSQHWLDVINQKAPHLLSPTGNELLLTEDGEEAFDSSGGRESFQAETNQETNRPPLSEDAVVSESEPALSQRNKSRETKGSARAGGKSWLNRLRFRPPMNSSGSGQSGYVSDSRRSGGTASSNAGGAGEKGTAATPRQPRLSAIELQDEISDLRVEGKPALRDRIVRLSRKLNNKARPSDRFGYHQPNPKSPGSHRARNEPQTSAPTHSAQRSLSSLEPVNEAEEDARSSIPRERDDSYVTNPRSRRSNEPTEDRSLESSAPKPDSKLKKLNRSSVISFAKREGERSSLHFAHQPTVESSAAEPATSFWERQQSRARRADEAASNAPETRTRIGGRSPASTIDPFNRSINSVTKHHRARNEFASTDLAASRANGLPSEAPENMWPALPVPPVFELADELAAMERETEGLRRLEHEQRGNPWNA
jgi:hypothetical protein